MKNHKQMCGLAVALDFLGDRWTLLIVRELLVAPRTFSQLQECLSGCSPNLLVARLRDMSQNGLLEQKPEVLAKREPYHLTPLGLSLRESVESLIRWGGALIPHQKQLHEKRPHWLELAVLALLRPKLKRGSRFRIQFVLKNYSFGISAQNFDLKVIAKDAGDFDCTLILAYERLLALMSGAILPKSLSAAQLTAGRFKTKAEAADWLQEVLQ